MNSLIAMAPSEWGCTFWQTYCKPSESYFTFCTHERSTWWWSCLL